MHVEFFSKNINAQLTTKLAHLAKNYEQLDIVVGFLSKYGLNQIKNICQSNNNLQNIRIVCGAITGKATRLTGGVPGKNFEVRIDLPYVYFKKSTLLFSPMTHTKMYIFRNNKEVCTITGSHNLSQFALEGKNVEAGVLLRGPADDTTFQEQQQHFDTIWSRAKKLNPALAQYYDTFFKKISGEHAFPEFSGNGFSDKAVYINSIIVVDPNGKTFSFGDTILLVNPHARLLFNAGKYHLLYLGSGKFAWVYAKGKNERTTGVIPHDYELTRTPSGSKFKLVNYKTKTIPATENWMSFEIRGIVNKHSLNAKLGTNTRTKKEIFNRIKFDDNDILTLPNPEFYEGRSNVDQPLVFKKMTGFIYDDNMKRIDRVINGLVDNKIKHDGYIFHDFERVTPDINLDNDGKDDLFEVLKPVDERGE